MDALTWHQWLFAAALLYILVVWPVWEIAGAVARRTPERIPGGEPR